MIDPYVENLARSKKRKQNTIGNGGMSEFTYPGVTPSIPKMIPVDAIKTIGTGTYTEGALCGSGSYFIERGVGGYTSTGRSEMIMRFAEPVVADNGAPYSVPPSFVLLGLDFGDNVTYQRGVYNFDGVLPLPEPGTLYYPCSYGHSIYVLGFLIGEPLGSGDPWDIDTLTYANFNYSEQLGGGGTGTVSDFYADAGNVRGYFGMVLHVYVGLASDGTTTITIMGNPRLLVRNGEMSVGVLTPPMAKFQKYYGAHLFLGPIHILGSGPTTLPGYVRNFDFDVSAPIDGGRAISFANWNRHVTLKEPVDA